MFPEYFQPAVLPFEELLNSNNYSSKTFYEIMIKLSFNMTNNKNINIKELDECFANTNSKACH